MSVFKKLGKWAKKNAGTIAKVALPVVGFAAGMVAPGVGAAIGKVADKIGNKVKTVTGIGDGLPGVFGIGDGLPGVFGIGTGKNILEKLGIEKIEGKTSTVDTSKSSNAAPEKLAKVAAQEDMKKEGISPMLLGLGGLLAFFALKK